MFLPLRQGVVRDGDGKVGPLLVEACLERPLVLGITMGEQEHHPDRFGLRDNFNLPGERPGLGPVERLEDSRGRMDPLIEFKAVLAQCEGLRLYSAYVVVRFAASPPNE